MRFLFVTLSLCLGLITTHGITYAEDTTQPIESSPTSEAIPRHGVALHGTPKYPAGFKHLDYVNPHAPKGGTLRQHISGGTFDSLNPFIVKGNPAAGLNYLSNGLVYESLMGGAYDEPFSMYGIIAKDITIAPNKSWVRFTLRDEAKWHDNKPITAEDVIWTFETLMKEGRPFYGAYWGDVETVTKSDNKTVTFTFKVEGNAELPMIIGQLPILPKHYWTAEGRIFKETTLEPPPGSGPYTIGKVDQGRSIEYIRHDDWWGKDLPFFKGMYNFDRLVYDYYGDPSVAHQAFLSQNYDFKEESTAKTWHEEYKVPDDKAANLTKEEILHKRPAGMTAFIYNIRRPIFQDKIVREALSYAYDFEWSNKQFAYGDYTRSNSYFENSELASFGLPSPQELAILEPLRGKIPDNVFTQTYQAPVTQGDGKIRQNLRTAQKLLEKAGYTTLDKNGIRTKTLENGKTQTLEFEILHYAPVYERWVLPFVQNLKKIGVKANFRIVDPAQFQNRVNSFDYDIIIGSMGQSNSPGNEQREFWGSDKADIKGSRNYIGIKDPVIDDLITQIIHATSRDDLVTKTRVLDRVLLWNHYIIPMWHYPKWRLAYWDTIKRPQTLSHISPMAAQTWWSRSAEEQQKEQQKEED